MQIGMRADMNEALIVQIVRLFRLISGLGPGEAAPRGRRDNHCRGGSAKRPAAWLQLTGLPGPARSNSFHFRVIAEAAVRGSLLEAHRNPGVAAADIRVGTVASPAS